MRLYLILLLLQLGQNVEFSFSQNVCSNLPTVAHAIVSGETKRVNYLEGHVIEFTCEPGYKSSQTPKYLCTSNGWLTVRQGTCFSCSTLPNVAHAVVSEETKKVDYQEGDMIHLTCDANYASGETIKYICTVGGWLAVQQGICVHVTCTVPVMHQHLSAAQLPAANERVKVGHRLQFECNNGYALEGSEHTECLETGQWSAPFPTCAETCTATGLSEGVHIAHNRRTVRVGQHVQFFCPNYNHFLRGEGRVECLADGKWSHPFPTCGVEPLGCSKPPPALENGQTVESIRPYYRPYEKVHYSCKNLYTMLAEDYMECVNNEWKGLMKCLEPCVVDREAMKRNNIDFRYAIDTGYASHGEEFNFRCVEGTKRNTWLSMRQICFYGSVQLPSCE